MEINPFPEPQQLREYLGDMDIYLLDQVLKGRIRPGMRILDAGCGGGRNLVYLLRCGIECYGTDQQDIALQVVRQLASALHPKLPSENFRMEQVENMSFRDDYFDFVICNAVLHFSRDERHFDAMLNELWRVLSPGGILFTRLASDIGIENQVRHLGGRRFLLPDGTERFLVNLKILHDASQMLDAQQIEPLKTVNVQNTRCMTNWVIGKKEATLPSPSSSSGKGPKKK